MTRSMTDAPYERVKQLMLEARERPPAERAAFLAQACGDDEGLRREVESLLSHDAEAPAFLDPPDLASQSGTGAPATAPAVVLGRIGPYRLARLLGEGGMGRVFLAEQTTPIRREVAIKVIRRGLDTDRVVARFESERQALAMMDHPGIARVFDAGADDGGRPYFVMERVQGDAITTYCERHRLSTRERLELFLLVCAAVQHAHQRGLIHRDLKPSNVLVGEQDGHAVPKIIDFGIAKAIEAAPGVETLTVQGQMVGTPDYMSPEQAGAVAGGVDTRTDVYSLGVILYELLAGRRPFRFEDATPAEVPRRMAEAEPARPSTAVASAIRERSAAHRASPTQLRREIAGDLDMIVLTALRKEPARRYASVEALAADIGRHLNGLPVSARPDTWTYRGVKFVRRHRVPVFAGAVALVVVAIVAAAYTLRLRAERDRANDARDEAEAVTGFLASMLQSPDPGQRGRDVTVRSVLERASTQIEREMASRPQVAAQLEEAIGRAYYGLGDLELAERHLSRSIRTRERLIGPDAPATLSVRQELVPVLTDAGRYAAAESLARLNYEFHRRQGEESEGALFALNAIADLAAYQGRQAEAESLFRYLLATRRRLSSQEELSALNTAGLLANLLADQGRFSEAESLYVPLLASYRRLGPEHLRAVSVANNLALLYMQTGRYAAAESLLAGVVETRGRVQGKRHPDTMNSTYNLGALYSEMGRYAEAEPLMLEVLAGHRELSGANAPITLVMMNNLARLYLRAGRLNEAEPLYRQTLAARRAALGPEHVATLGTQVGLAMTLGKEGKTTEAEALFSRTLTVQRRVLGPRHTNTLNTAYSAGQFQLDAGRSARAEPLLAEATTGVGEAFGEQHQDWVRYGTVWGRSLTALGRYAEADSLLQRVWKRWETVKLTTNATPAATATALAELCEAWKKPAEARAWRQRAADLAAGGPLTAAARR
jgi:serine/threonine protein kinase/tetratricopeptide (TPR) repeat protein